MNPFLTLYAQWSRIAQDSQHIIAIRMLGMSGLMPTAPGENDRMLREKWLAGWQSAWAAGQAVGRGASPVAVALAATAPVARKTRANRRRLG